MKIEIKNTHLKKEREKEKKSKNNCLENDKTYRSHCRNVHDAIIHSETMNTRSTVPGHMVINVFSTNLIKIENEFH